jgi:hypothetical protein
MRVKPNAVRLSIKREADAEKQILGFDRRVIWQAEFPQRYLIGALLANMDISARVLSSSINSVCAREPFSNAERRATNSMK